MVPADIVYHQAEHVCREMLMLDDSAHDFLLFPCFKICIGNAEYLHKLKETNILLARVQERL